LLRAFLAMCLLVCSMPIGSSRAHPLRLRLACRMVIVVGAHRARALTFLCSIMSQIVMLGSSNLS
jgi:hypothetical protein